MTKPKQPTPKQIESICDVVRRGNYLSTAAALARVSDKTVDAWLRAAKDEEGRREEGVKKPRKSWQGYVDFAQALSVALVEAESAAVTKISDISSGNDVPSHVQLRAAQWLLERRHPDKWSKRIIDPTRDNNPDAPTQGIGTGDIADITRNIDENPPTRPADFDECVDVLTSIIRGQTSNLKSTAKGELFIQTPTAPDKINAASVLARLLTRRDKAKPDTGKTVDVGIYRDEEE